MNGIYCYIDKQNENKVVYVGKDSSIHIRRRHREHLSKNNKNNQPFNKVLQRNPQRYKYKVIKKGNFSESLLNALEIIYIKRYGTYDNRKGHGKSYGFNFTIGGDGVVGLTVTLDQKIKQSQSQGNKTGFFRVSKILLKNGTWKWKYRYSKQKHTSVISNKSLEYLLEEVLGKKLPWYIIDENVARETCWKHGYDERVMLKNHNINDIFI